MAVSAAAAVSGSPLGTNEAARAGNLARSRQSARAAQTGGPAPRGLVYQFPVDAAPGQTRSVSQVTKPGEVVQFPKGRSVDDALAFAPQSTPEEQRRLENENKARLQAERNRIRSEVQQYKLPEFSSLPTKDQKPLQKDFDQFANNMLHYAQQQAETRVGDMRQQMLQQMKEKAKNEIKQKIKKQIKDKLIKKQGKRLVWRIFGRGSELEDEGAFAWTWSVSGHVATGIQALKEIMRPDGKDFLGEPISWLEPPNIGIKDSLKPDASNIMDAVQVWFIDVLDIAVWLFVVVIVIVVIHLFLALIGFFIYSFMVVDSTGIFDIFNVL